MRIFSFRNNKTARRCWRAVSFIASQVSPVILQAALAKMGSPCYGVASPYRFLVILAYGLFSLCRNGDFVFAVFANI